MGIFADSREEDTDAISQIVESSLAFYTDECSRRGRPAIFEIAPSFDFGYISDIGGRILSEFTFQTALHRVATLVVLCNSCRPFSLTREGRLLLDLNVRRDLLSRFTCILLAAALSTISVERDDRKYSLRWVGFPDAYYCDQFLIYLRWIEAVTVVPGGDRDSKQFKAAMGAFDKLLAHLVLGCALALQCCVTEELAIQPAQLLNRVHPQPQPSQFTSGPG